jgi:ribosomal protein S3AE
MKYYDWDEVKNSLLKETRNISFEEIILSLSNNQLLEIVEHPQKQKYPNQKIFIVEVSFLFQPKTQHFEKL